MNNHVLDGNSGKFDLLEPKEVKSKNANAKKNCQKESPLEHADWFEIATASWISSLIKLGAVYPLTEEDIWPISPSDSCESLSERYYRYWDEERVSMNPSYARALIRAFRSRLCVCLIFFLASMGFNLLQPFFIKSILQHLSGVNSSAFGISSGYVLTTLMASSVFGAVQSINIGYFLASRIATNIRSFTMDLVYRKALRLSSSSRQSTTTGEIVMLMSVDSERLVEATMLILWVFLSPMMMLFALVLISIQLSTLSAIAAAMIMCSAVFSSIQFSKAIGKTRTKLLVATEERVKLTSEALQGIRVIKYYAWEEPTLRRIQSVRLKEVQMLKEFHYFRLANECIMFICPIVTSAVSFLVYAAQGGELTPTKAYTVLGFITVSKMAQFTLPSALAHLSEAIVATKRIGEYLCYDELEVEAECPIAHTTAIISQAISSPVIIRDAEFTWSNAIKEPNSISLRIPDLKISPGDLVMVIGPVGSGKSSLINAMLGEMHQSRGLCSVSGKIAYVSQEPWITNASVRNNILFNKPMEFERYMQILQAVQLSKDIATLTDGDRTEIGERGMNLSGGQKARISLARALYSNDTDIYLLDDPLSAVDVHVAKRLFDECIMRMMSGQTRILVLNSHYHFLPYADRILVLDNGKIIADGKYNELNKSFSSLGIYKTSESTEEMERDHQIMNDGGYVHDLQVSRSPIQLMDVEDRQTGAVNSSVYVRYFQQSGINGIIILALILFAFGSSQSLSISVDWWLGLWCLNSKSASYASIYSCLVLISAIAVFASAFIFINIAILCSKHIHDNLISVLFRAPITKFFDVTPLGRILNRFSRDLDLVDTSLPDMLMQLIQYSFIIIGVLVVCVTSSPWILIFYIPLSTIYIFTQHYFQKTSRELKRLEGITRSPIFSTFAETLNGLQTIRAFQMNNIFIERCRAAIDFNTAIYFDFWSVGRWLAVRLDYLAVTIIFVVGTCLVALRGTIDSSASGLALVYALQLTAVLQWATRMAGMTENNMTAVERLLHFTTIDSEAPNAIAETCPGAQWPKCGEIQIEGLCFRYRPGLKQVLKDVNLHIHAKEKLGVCGRTGAGKSSLIMALFRIGEFDSGRIRIDGVDIATIGLRTLRSKISIIPQDPVLFCGTLRENLDAFGEADDDTLWKILQQVHLYRDVQALPGGLSFVVAERGENMSVGQRQLLCIGRALLRQSHVIVMDEATASIDLETDRLIQETIRSTFTNQTVIIIAHRLDTIKHCDRIVVLEDGRIIECGAPKLLMSNPESAFRRLAIEAGILDEDLSEAN